MNKPARTAMSPPLSNSDAKLSDRTLAAPDFVRPSAKANAHATTTNVRPLIARIAAAGLHVPATKNTQAAHITLSKSGSQPLPLAMAMKATMAAARAACPLPFCSNTLLWLALALACVTTTNSGLCLVNFGPASRSKESPPRIAVVSSVLIRRPCLFIAKTAALNLRLKLQLFRVWPSKALKGAITANNNCLLCLLAFNFWT
mmetsp:Transcript_28017/g.55129  ORF Transcript_28017/g.55129 Transcript_28017/m.55129 type:complete len:202 (+) Transcript_28017:519-1124(+)